jgi:hypothetical protein
MSHTGPIPTMVKPPILRTGGFGVPERLVVVACCDNKALAPP